MKNVIEVIPIQIKNQPELLNLLSQGYKSLSKALMEYIDNSFDSADDFYEEKNNKYSRDVSIKIIIDRKNKEIHISDNCTGMSLQAMKGLACSINESNKKRKDQKRAWVNGEFGLGAHAFRFFANKLTVISKKKNRIPRGITIESKSKNAHLIAVSKRKHVTGTVVIVSGISASEMKKLKTNSLKKDIETYFERLLDRNAQIIISDGNEQMICEPFDYKSIDGFKIHKTIKKWRDGSATVTVPGSSGVIVKLKVALLPMESKPPLFTRKGRRINTIHDLSSFISKTKHRKNVWANPYLTGYIEVQNNLDVVITRDDFRGGKKYAKKRDGIYKEIIELEDEIYKTIELVNQDKREKSLKNFASKLSEILSKLAREDLLKLQNREEDKRSSIDSKEKITIEARGELYEIKKSGQGENSTNLRDRTEIVKARKADSSKLKGRRINKPQTAIQIDFQNIKNPGRSLYDAGTDTLIIISNHPDFVERTGKKSLKEIKINQKLVSYISAVISSEYKGVLYSRKNQKPDIESILREQIDFIIRFEKMLNNYIGQPLGSVGKSKNI